MYEYRKFAKDLKPLNEEGDLGENDARSLITPEELSEAYTAISEFYSSLDFDSIVNIVESLKGYRFPEDRIHRIFKRPFDAKYVTEELLSVAEVANENRLGKRIAKIIENIINRQPYCQNG